MNYYAAVWNGMVVGTRTTSRVLTHAVIHTGHSRRGLREFASFHPSHEHALANGTQLWVRSTPKHVVGVIETEAPLAIGQRLEVGALVRP